MRGWLSTRRSYIPPVEIGARMRALAVGVVQTPCAGFRKGEFVQGTFGWGQYVVVPGDKVRRVHVPDGFPVSAVLGVLGITGRTAYFGLLRVGEVKNGDVVVVSAAAGATGSVVAQIAKNVYGCYVIGIAGGGEKCRYLEEELGIVAVDYKSQEGVDAGLKRALAGREIDIYFDNVGGSTLEAALRRLANYARIVLCGAISVYNEATLPPGPRNYHALISKRGKMQGFLLYDYEKDFGEADESLGRWLKEGKLMAREHRIVGLRQAPDALKALFDGRNIGKVVVKVWEDGDNGWNDVGAKL